MATEEALLTRVSQLEQTVSEQAASIRWMQNGLLLCLGLFLLLSLILIALGVSMSNTNKRLRQAVLRRNEQRPKARPAADMATKAEAPVAPAPAGPAWEDEEEEPRPPEDTAPTQAAVPEAQSLTGKQIMAELNEMLVKDPPGNFYDQFRMLYPRHVFQTLTPDSQEAFVRRVVLAPGGTELFACVQGNRALLFPNHAMFSRTFDPTPFFDGTQRAQRIQRLASPAVLERDPQRSGCWVLAQKGSVTMKPAR